MVESYLAKQCNMHHKDCFYKKGFTKFKKEVSTLGGLHVLYNLYSIAVTLVYVNSLYMLTFFTPWYC